MMDNQTVTITKPKKPRQELRLPQLHFVAMDDWVEKLGEKAFVLWLKLLTHADRRDPDRIQDKVPYDIESLAKKHLGMSKAKFYRLIKPLWNYGLIDLIEYEASTRKTQKPVNVVVYEYPQNDYALAIKPLEKLREYDTDYASSGTIFGKKGGRPQKDKDEVSYRFKNETVGKYRLNRFNNKTVTVSKVKRSTVSKMKPSNELNESKNESNDSTNVSNESSSSVANLDSTIHNRTPQEKNDDDEKRRDIHQLTDSHFQYRYLYDYLKDKAVSVKNIEATILECYQQNITEFYRADLDRQWEQVIKQLNRGRITVFSKFFVHGLKIVLENKAIQDNHIDQVQREQAATEEHKQARLQKISLHNWLEQ